MLSESIYASNALLKQISESAGRRENGRKREAEREKKKRDVWKEQGTKPTHTKNTTKLQTMENNRNYWVLYEVYIYVTVTLNLVTIYSFQHERNIVACHEFISFYRWWRRNKITTINKKWALTHELFIIYIYIHVYTKLPYFCQLF